MTAADPYGVAYVTVLADLDKFEGDLSKKMQKGLDSAGKSAKFDELDKTATKEAEKTGQNMEKGLEKGLDSKKEDLKKAADKAGQNTGNSFLTGLRRMLFSRGGLYTLLGAGAAGLLGGGQSLLPATLALIPGLAIGAAGALGTLELATHGFFGAISAGMSNTAKSPAAWAKALKDLAPAAQSVAKEIVGMKGAFTQLQQLVQQNFFLPLEGSFQQLARSLLPTLRAQMPALAKTFGQLGQSFLAGFSYFGSNTAIGTILTQLNNGLRPFIPLLSQAVNLFLRVGAVAAPFLSQLAGMAAGKFSDFLTKLDTTLGNGGVLKFFSEAGNFLVSLGGALGPILGLLGDILGAFAQFGSPTLALLGTLATVLRTALAPVLGPLAGFLSQLVTGVGNLLTALAPGLAAIFGAIGQFFNAIAGQLPSLVGALTPLLQDISALLVAAGPSLGALLAQVATSIFPLLVQALQDMLPLWQQMTPFWVQFAQQVLPQLVPLLAQTLALLTALLPVLPPLVNLLVQMVPVLVALIPLFVQVIKFFVDALRVSVPIVTFLANVVGGFINLIAALDKFMIHNVWLPVFHGIADAINAITSAIKTAIGWLDSLLGKSKSVPGAQAAIDAVRGANAPKYASGGLVTAPTLAMVGEGGSPEAIIPMGSPGQARSVARRTGLLSMLGSAAGGWAGTVHVYLGSREITDIVSVIVDDKIGDAADGINDGTRG